MLMMTEQSGSWEGQIFYSIATNVSDSQQWNIKVSEESESPCVNSWNKRSKALPVFFTYGSLEESLVLLSVLNLWTFLFINLFHQ